ncbi:MAG: acetyl esterase [Solirubrobacteraceae bacterium]|nr:acetyl esterase [Solirubrobacteraceae bacterium]
MKAEGLHPQAARLIDPPGPPPWEIPVEEQRAGHAEGTPAKAGPLRAVGEVEDREIAGVPCRIYEPFGAARGTLVNFHGGGWVLGTLDTYDHVARALCAESAARVVNVGYRVAPEHPFPAAVEDAWAVVSALDGPLAVCGDSAGGNLAAVCALRARDAGLPLALQVLVFPVCDAAMDSGSWRSFAEGHNLDAREMRWFWETYLDGADGLQPDASPLRAADLRGAAPALVITCSHDILRDEAETYAHALRAAGVPTRLERYEGMVHGFWRAPALVDDARRAHREVGLAVWAAFAQG